MIRSVMRCRTWWFRTESPTAVVETRLTAADGSTFDADVVFFDPSSWARVILEVSIVTIGSDTSLGRGARAGLDEVNAQLRAREEDKRKHSFVQRLLNEAGKKHYFHRPPGGAMLEA